MKGPFSLPICLPTFRRMTKPQSAKISFPSHFFPVLLKVLSIGFFLMLSLQGCGSEPAFLPIPRAELPTISFNGFDIPKFPTAQGQLNFAKSWFSDTRGKKAALLIVSELFPRARLQCGNADLALAYMNLGEDYRFASRSDFLKAITDYRKLLDKYRDQPRILAKAHWYLGWIHCELLGKKPKGLVHFKIIVTQYPGVAMELSSPVPWVSLVYPLDPREQSDIRIPKMHWAGIALLEIIRNAPPDEAIMAFDALWQGYKNSAATGFALKLMLENPLLADHSRSHVPAFLARNIANPYLAKEIQTLAGKN